MKIKLTVLTLLFGYLGFAQLTYVPDDNFENYLETHDSLGNVSSVNTMGNGISGDNYVTTANITSVFGLNITNLSITDLTGIEDFTNIGILWCNNNQLSTLNLANNTSLQSIQCSDNLLTSLDVSQNLSLTALYCNNNQIDNLDLTPNLNLLKINCSNNQLTGFNIQNGNNPNITVFDSTNNPNLTCVEVDNTTFSTTNWTNIDTQTNFSHSCSGIDTYVPDNNFEDYLETHDANGNSVSINSTTNLGNGVMDNHVPTAKINTITSLNVSNKNIDSLTGIEDFIALTNLTCYVNQLQNLDVSQNTALIYLNCNRNQLQNLDVSQNTALTNLTCYVNQLQTLDVSQNTALTYLVCNENQLQTLNVTQNTALNNLNCNRNQLQILNVTQNTALTHLICSVNQLQNLDVSQNTALTSLSCYNNQLQNLDVSQNTALTNLSCFNNQLQNLDVSQNTALTYLSCESNQLTSLNMKNGNNANIFNNNFYATSNPNLTCIQVDDTIYSLSWQHIDATAYFNENCNYPTAETYVPDDNFENYLETHNISGNTVSIGDTTSMGNGIANDDYVTTSKIDTVINLSIANKGIEDLTGIEDFNALGFLLCNNNQLNSINVTQNTALTYLACYNNQITSLDITQNTTLTFLNCRNNGINTLNITQNTALITLECGNNSLNSIDITQNTVLEQLHCFNNPLGSLDITQNIALSSLRCFNNQLNSLDASQNTSLTVLDCRNNQLISLNMKNGNNTNVLNSDFRTGGNIGLTCIEVDDAAWSTTNWLNIDSTSFFSTSCTAVTNEYNFENNLLIYPNPASNNIIIKTDRPSNYKFFNITGQLLNKGILSEGDNNIDVSKLLNGIYFIKINSNHNNTTLKLIKK